MKKCIYIISIILFTASSSFAQWTWQNPLPHGNTYNDIKFISQSKGFAAGDFGQFYMTTNQGMNWSKIDLGTTKHLWSINMINNNTGWVCGDSNLLYKTENGGINWTAKVTGFTGNYYDIRFLNDSTGLLTLANPSFIIKTTNAGNNWFSVYSASYPTIGKMYFSDANTGWSSCGSYVFGGYNSPNTEVGLLMTTDKGNNWTYSYTNKYFQGHIRLNSIFFNNSNTGFITSDNSQVLKTTNSGQNWNGLGMYLNSPVFYNQYYGFAVHDKIYRTTDSNYNWVVFNSEYPVKYKSVCFADSSNYWFTGTGGEIVNTTNAGLTFQEKGNYTRKSINSVSFVNSMTGFVCGNNGLIMKTTNGGSNWLILISNLFGSKKFKHINFINGNTGWSCADSFIVKTTNGGLNWTKNYIVLSNQSDSVKKVVFDNSGTGFAATNINLFKSTDYGETWELNFTNSNGVSLIRTRSSTLFVYNRYYIFKSTNNGMNWNTISYSSGASIDNGDFIDENKGWFCFVFYTYPANYQFIIYKTLDGGTTWTSSYGGRATSIFGYNDNEVLFINGSTLMKSSNGGTSWYNTNLNGNTILGLGAYGKDLYVVGEYGMIMKGTDIFTTDIQNISTETPLTYSLSQNYPNPFNPTTKISFALPKAGLVTIKVFDVLGKEIETLVNESLKPGTYEAAFDGSSYPSGVYFYRLSTKGFTETKRMVLIK